MKTINQILEKEDAYLDLPGPLASWVDEFGRKKIKSESFGEHWKLTIKGVLTGADLGGVGRRLDGVQAKGNAVILLIRK